AEPRLAVGPRRLDLQRPRTHQPVDDPLVEVDVVDPGERDLDAVLREHTRAVDDALVGAHEVRELPVEERLDQPHRPTDRDEPPDPRARRAHPTVETEEHEEQQDEQAGTGRDLACEEPPVRLEVQDDRLAGMDQSPRIGHDYWVDSTLRSPPVAPL